MKINRMTQNYGGIQKKVSINKGSETIKDQISLGQKNDNLGIMERPLVSMKSDSIGDAIGNAILKLGVMAGGVGALSAGAGIAGRTMGGPVGIAVATGASALIGGAILGKAMSGYSGTSIARRGFEVGAVTAGAMSLAGAGLSGIGSPLAGGILGVSTGAVGGGVGFLGGLLFTE